MNFLIRRSFRASRGMKDRMLCVLLGAGRGNARLEEDVIRIFFL